MNQITDQLWISDISTVRERELDVDLVVGVCQDDVFDNVSATCAHVNLADGEADGYGGSADYETFAAGVEYVRTGLRNDQETVVYCHAGLSRSAAVCMAALAVETGCSFADAYARVEDARPMVNPVGRLRRHARDYIIEHS